MTVRSLPLILRRFSLTKFTLKPSRNETEILRLRLPTNRIVWLWLCLRHLAKMVKVKILFSERTLIEPCKAIRYYVDSLQI